MLGGYITAYVRYLFVFQSSLRGTAQFATLIRMKSNDPAGIFHPALESRRSLSTGSNLDGAFPLGGRLGALLRAPGELTDAQSDLVCFCGGRASASLREAPIRRHGFWNFGRRRGSTQTRKSAVG